MLEQTILLLDKPPEFYWLREDIARFPDAVFLTRDPEFSISDDGELVEIIVHAVNAVHRRTVPLARFRRSNHRITAIVRKVRAQVARGEIEQPEFMLTTMHSGEATMATVSPWRRFCRNHERNVTMLDEFDARKPNVVQFRSACGGH